MNRFNFAAMLAITMTMGPSMYPVILEAEERLEFVPLRRRVTRPSRREVIRGA